MKKRLLEKFVKENLEKAKGALFFGIPIEDLNREELIAFGISGWDAQRKEIENSKRERDFLFDITK